MTQEELKSILLYDPATGRWFWLVGRNQGKEAGMRMAGKHTYLKIGGREGKSYVAARLAWLYMTGEWPSGEIDHIDNDPTNDCWYNLRDVSSSQNKANVGLRRNNTSGVRGVTWDKAKSKWLARVHIGNHYIMKRFLILEEAEAWVREMHKEVHGEFSHFHHTELEQ